PLAVGAASFGPLSFNLTAAVVLVANGTSQPRPLGDPPSATDGCEAVTNNVIGKIVLIDRGACTYVQKVLNAQNAGAVGVIIANNLAGAAPPSMPGSDPTITIGTFSITFEAGAALKTALIQGPVTATMESAGGERSDGSLDNGVIIHEYGHGLSNRLTGGPSNTGCLANAEQAGEGWSDLLTLMLTAQATDTAVDPIAIGNWLLAQPADGIGIRLRPYTTDTALNNYTYDSIKTVEVDGTDPRVHDVGEIWATMVWDVYWSMVDEYGFDPDLIAGNGGNRIALQLMIDGLKLQNCSPSFVDARNGILAADIANNNGVNQCVIWETFARRGLGYSADAGSADNHLDGTEAYDLPPLCTLEIQPQIVDACIGDPLQLAVNVGESFAGPVSLSQNGAPGSATFSTNPAATDSNVTLSTTTAGLSPQSLAVTVTGVGPQATYSATVQLNLAAAPAVAPTLSAPGAGAGNVSIQPLFSWAASAQAASYRVEIDDEPTFTNPLFDLTVRDTDYMLSERLRDDTTYYWRVTALNGCGVSPLSASSFTTRDRVDLLLVDDAVEGTDSQVIYTAALDALGLTYDVWRGVNLDDEPPLGTLNNYRSVIWLGGYDLNGVPSPAAQQRLTNWLPGGRCLLLSSQELFARSDMVVTPFISTVLGVETMADDSVHTSVTAESGGIFDGLGGMALSFDGDNYSDYMAPNASGVLQLSGNGTNGSGAAVSHDAGTYRTLYFGFPLEALNAANLQAVLQRSLNWCAEQPVQDLQLSLDVTPAAEVLLPGQSIGYVIDFRNDGTTTVNGAQLQLNLPAQLVDVAFENSGPALTLSEGAGYEWTIGAMAPGASGTLIVAARVNPALNAAAEDQLEVTLIGGGTELDGGNQSQAALLRTRVPAVNFSADAYSAVEADGIAAISVALSEANPHADTSVAYAVAGGTATVGDDFTLAAGTVTIPAGATSAEFMVIIAADAVADDGETVLLKLSTPQGAALGKTSDATLTIGDSDPPQPRIYLPLLNR
ncbi:MAG: DUF11 domain-containing protein, partial [Oscillochloris sp.]|nr:DUF11 domain-containing protein [Oscillochloris sp.]